MLKFTALFGQGARMMSGWFLATVLVGALVLFLFAHLVLDQVRRSRKGNAGQVGGAGLDEAVPMMDLRGKQARVMVSRTAWTSTLELAHICGWHPVGTQKRQAVMAGAGNECEGLAERPLSEWQTQYLLNDGREVGDADAQSLGQALEIAQMNLEHHVHQWHSPQDTRVPALRTPAAAFKWFRLPQGSRHLQSVISLCRGGGFEIW